MEKFKILFVKTESLKIEEKELEAPNRYDLLKPVGELVNGWCELVHPQRLPYPYCFICDEEGRMKEDQKLNIIGTLLYNKHSQFSKSGSFSALTGVLEPIIGNIVIMKEVEKRGGIDLIGLDDNDIAAIKAIIQEFIVK